MNKAQQTHERILDTAESMFATKGYRSVRLRDVAQALELKHTAFYYYAKSKEELYVQVMERNFKRHQRGMEQAIHEAGEDVREQMRAVAHWLMSQSPINIGQMMQSDFAELGHENVMKLADKAFEAMRMPLETAFQGAKDRGLITTEDPGLAAISFVSLIETVNSIREPSVRDEHQVIIDRIVDMLLKGLLVR
jgi:AcrR family transcriptional regulator